MTRFSRISGSSSVLALLFLLAACGEPAPAAWNANLDIDCQPQDPYDKLYASLAPEKFWREQEYDMGSLMKAGEKNLEMSQQVLDESRAQKGQYLQRAEQAASDLGLSGQARRDHIRDNIERYNKEVDDIKQRLDRQEVALNWVRKCTRAVQRELRKLNLEPVEYDPEKRPM